MQPESNNQQNPIKAWVPNNIEDLIRTAKVVIVHWQASGIPLLWTNPNDFQQCIKQLDERHHSKINSKAIRKRISHELRQLDKSLERNLSHIKAYLREKYPYAKAVSLYPTFGIEYLTTYKRFSFPKDRDERLRSLQTMLEGIQKHGFQQKTYGLAYWQKAYDNFKQLKTEAEQHDSENANRTLSKKELTQQTKRTLQAIFYLIRANYPDEHRDIARAWGFQREKY